jgi:lipid A 3-O-deacylase
MTHFSTMCTGAALALAFTFPALAQQADRLQETVHFATFENDMYFDTDRYYTNGIQFSTSHAQDQRGRIGHLWTGWLCAAMGCEHQRLMTSQANVGQLMYTPRDITVKAVQADDRPYAGLLYYEQVFTFISPDQRTLTTLSAEVGVTGRASLAEQAQKMVHRMLDRPLPQGWDHQVGGSLGLLATAERRTARPALSARFGKDVQLNTATFWRLGLGNIMSYAATGVQVVVGKNLPEVSPPPPGIGNKLRAGGSRVAPSLATSCLVGWLQCSAFATVEARAVGYSVFLDGRIGAHDQDVKRRALVGDVMMGVRVDFPDTRSASHGPWFAQFKVTRRSPEFRSRVDVPFHRFGALTIGTEF